MAPERIRARNWTGLLALLLGLTLSACSSDQLYAAGRNAQKLECQKLNDAMARDRCLRDAGMSHDSYQREAEAARR